MVESTSRSIMPAMEREKIIELLGSPGFFTNIPREYKVSVAVVAALPKIIARISGYAENVRRLNDAETARMAALFAIVKDDGQWEQLSPLERLNLRQELTNLSHRRAINP